MALGVALIAGCNRKIKLPTVENQRPVIQLTQTPVATTTPYFYSYEVRWTGFDPDGRVEHYLYALDPPPPPATDTAWVVTTDNRKLFTFASGDPEVVGTHANPGGYHTLIFKAVDNQGLASEPVVRSFFSYTVAPEVRIISPVPNALLHPILPPAMTFRWSGIDPDGVTTRKPVKYKFHLFKDGVDGFSLSALGALLDSLRFAWPPQFKGWDSTLTDTSAQYTNLTPGSGYVFAVVCFDEAGAYSPTWTFSSDLLWFYCDFPLIYGPKLTMYNESFTYTYLSPGYLNDPRRYVNLEVPVGKPITFHWIADPGQYSAMVGYRWAMDIARLDDETPRTGPADVQHWSYSALSNTSATVGPFGSTDSTHTFFIEAEDNNNLKSLGIIAMSVVKPDFGKELLFVGDVSFLPDQRIFGTDSIAGPPGTDWPSIAELDTFFFARGGVRWRYYPPGTLSPPGIFSGYHYDTLGTRSLPSPPVPLSTLAKYRHIVWYVDQAASVGDPTPALRVMNLPGIQNTLGTYVNMGGQVWLMGGGGAFNTLIPFNVKTNDLNGATVFSYAAGELVPGRFMYDLAHWRSEISAVYSQAVAKSPRAVGGWPGAPDYSSLPSALRSKNRATDPIWPLRIASGFYRTNYLAEFLSKKNEIVEDVSPDPEITRLASTLDTLYTAVGGIGEGMPVMTYYHGSESPPFVFSGFPLWFFRRTDAIAVADWVLQNVWHLPRDPVWRGPDVAPAVVPAPARPASGAGPSTRPRER